MSTETVSAEKAGEIAAEVVEDVAEDVVEMVEIVRNNPIVLTVVGVLGLAAGAAGGYFLTRKFLREHYADIAEEEIAEAKEFYAGLNKVSVAGEPLSPQEVMAQRHPEAVEALREYQGVEVETPARTEEELLEHRVTQARIQSVNVGVEGGPEHGVHPIEKVEERQEKTRNVFVDPTFDLPEEVKHRTKDRPYVISHDEYFAAEHEDYDTIQLTYYEKDDTLVGENDKPVDDVNSVIGDDSLARFGHGSKDKNIVYVRNDKLRAEYEVTLSDQSYLEALGLGPEPDSKELKHSADRRRALRNGDG